MNTTAEQLELPWVPELSPSTRAELGSRIQPRWQTRAACADADPVLFDYPDDGWEDPDCVAQARRICHGCPVRRSCLFTALLGDEQGIWGGHTDAARDDIRDALANPHRRDHVLGPTEPSVDSANPMTLTTEETAA